MKPTCIELPLDDSIECWSFTRAIAKAIHPTLDDATGIDCVIGKLVTYENVDQHLQFPFSVTDAERAALEPLLEHLPKLHGRMYDLEIETFLYLYSALPNRLLWVPRLFNRADLDRIEYEQWDRQAGHREQLQQRLQDGKIQAFDSDRFPAKRIGPNVYIPRKQAVTYLLECGIEICSADESKNLSEIWPKDISQPDVKCILESTKINAVTLQTRAKRPSQKANQEEWTDDQLIELSNLHAELAINHRDPTRRVAKEYQLSNARVRQLLDKKKQRIPAENSHFRGLVKR